MIENNIKELQEMYIKRKLVPFVGSGLSRPLGLPTWKELIFGFSEYCNYEISENLKRHLDKGFYYEAIDALLFSLKKDSNDFKEYIGKTLRERIREIDELGLNKNISVYPYLKQMEFPVYLTTNYDNFISNTLNYHSIDLRYFEDSDRQLETNSKVVYNLHGDYHNPLKMLVTKEEYDNLYSFENKIYQNNLSKLISNFNLIFLGYSFDDLYFCNFLKLINKFSKNKHFILLNNPDEYRINSYKREYNIQVIPFNNVNSSYTMEILKILEQIDSKYQESKSYLSRQQEYNNDFMPFMIDAADLPSNSNVLNNLVYKNYPVNEFLNRESYYRCVCSPAGLGKTLLLNLKRNIMEEQGYTCIPSNQELIDRLNPDDLIIKNNNAKLLDSVSQWENIWKISIILCTLKKHYRNLENTEKQEKNQTQNTFGQSFIQSISDICSQSIFISTVFCNMAYNKPSDIIKGILQLSKKEFALLIEKNLGELVSIYACIHTNYAIFIDNVDELNKTPNDGQDIYYGSEELVKIVYGKFNPKLWFYMQIGLLLAEYRLSRENSHIKIFISMRKEAYDCIDKYSSMVDKFKSHACILRYSSDDLKNILENYLSICSKRYFLNDINKANSYYKAFFGVSEVYHSYANEKEDIFNYIYRHSLKRPRDIMRFCKSIVENRGKDIKEVINVVASEIVKEYLNECDKFLEDKIYWSDLYRILEKRCLQRMRYIKYVQPIICT